MENKFYVYAWYIMETLEVFYIGKGSGNRRFETSRRNKFFKNVYAKHDCNVLLLVENQTEENAFRFEIDAVKFYRIIGECKCNMTDGGEGASGCKRSDETKAKLMGNKNSLGHSNRLGHKTSDETRKKQSLAHKNISDATRQKMSKFRTGYKLSDEHKAKISESSIGKNKGKIYSEETKKKLSLANIGKILSEETKKKISEASKLSWQRRKEGVM